MAMEEIGFTKSDYKQETDKLSNYYRQQGRKSQFLADYACYWESRSRRASYLHVPGYYAGAGCW